MNVRPSEGQHWYYPDGTPCYEVPRADGKGMREATLRDARKLGLFPGVSSILRCADRPGLNRWMQEQVLLAALTLPKIEGEKSEDYCKRIMQDSQEQGRKAADRGTAIHAAIQEFFETGDVDDHTKEFVGCVGHLIDGWLPYGDCKVEKSFGHPMGFGGKVDLHSTDGWVCDFKTKEFGPDDDLKTWDEHAMQLAAYREGLGIPNARAAIVYVSASVPGLARLIEIDGEDLEKGWEMFQGLLSYWQAKNKYASAFEESIAA